jgi:hypothetical protein
MFNLEQSIADWRRQMLAAGIQTPVPLEELEIHLREEIGVQLKSGKAAQQAFEHAVPKIGTPHQLKGEFQKANPLTIDRIISIAVGIPAALVGLWGVRLAAIQGRDLGTMTGDEVRLMGLFILASLLAMALLVLGLILLFYGGRNVSWLPNAKAKRKYV